MERIIIMASHHKLADGLKDTLNFVTGGVCPVVALSAYLDNKPVEGEVAALMDTFAPDQELVILTDTTSGSVNQNFYKYRTRPHTHIISGMSLPLAVMLALESTADYLTEDRVRQIVAAAREEIKYMADIAADEDDEDE